MNASQDLLAAALKYASQGWPVIPLHTPKPECSCGQGNCGSPGKHPRTRHGLADATTSSRKIRAWWRRWPEANIGILTGPRSGLLVVDLDEKGDRSGAKNFAAMASASGAFLPDTIVVKTGTGTHYYFIHPCEPIQNSASKIVDGVDIRADGGYVVAPPSLHANGSRYQFQVNDVLAALPAWLIDAITENPRARQTMTHPETNPFTEAKIVSEGERNDTLFRLASALRGQQGMEQEQIEPILLEFNGAKCDPPLSDEEVMAIAESACRYPAETRKSKSFKRQEENPLYWFPFSVRDWFSDLNLNLMSDRQTGWYIRLKVFAWQKGGFLPSDPDKLWKLAKSESKQTFDSDCELVLAEFEPLEINGQRMLKNERMATQYAETLAKWLKKKEAGAASRIKRVVGAPRSVP